MRLGIGKALGMGLAGLIVIFALLVGALFLGAMRLGSTSDWVIRTHETLRYLEALETSVPAAESPHRGYLAFLGEAITELQKQVADLGGALESGDADKVRGAAHKLKGSAATMGMLAVAADASEMETRAR